MVVMSTMGFHRRTQADTGDDHHERSDAKTLNKRHGASMDLSLIHISEPTRPY